MTEKRYKSIGANLECSNGMEYTLIKRNDGFNVCQVCSKYTAKEIVDELNSLADENEQLKKELSELIKMTEERNCGHCKHLQIDGMFGMWCDKGRNWGDTDADYCSDYER